MNSNKYRYRSHIFSLSKVALAMHENLITCVIFGKGKNVRVVGEKQEISGSIVCIKPDVMHGVFVPAEGAEVLYLDGVKLPKEQSDFILLDNQWADIPNAFFSQDHARINSLREALDASVKPSDPRVLAVIEQLFENPLERMSQEQLSEFMELERTQALKVFKRETGQTFRRFKKWAASVTLTSLVFNDGEIISHAGLDAGFSDAAHTTRTAREVFGLTPTEGASSLRGISTFIS